ncbi:hypothetical protein BXT86_04125 [candidate division WOR-3 bacterium 4484_100]|uniref:Metallo-beta-lactamase domain-containing protein n=1 Tax=candidate division WOR-3 bacterium 4484_100 TaxID=1936077 RepID=A0A1V4QF90_UNCW3|nr:MAG: hypothetical protein BXT86_04125 [candidate division WOR-3 bacterium 4484_100]
MEIRRCVVGPLETNCYIISSERKGIIIDPGDEAQKIIKEISDLEIIMILATHNHFDHITALKPIKEYTRSKAGIHPEDWVEGFDIRLEDGQTIELGKERLRVIHTPGHTPGGCSFYTDKILFSGDTLFKSGIGNTSFPGGDEEAIYKSIRERLLALPEDTLVYPGHGPSTTIGAEKAWF